jgi:prenyltransferase beta subunit
MPDRPMYDHAFGTLFLAEVYGMTERADIREKLRKAVTLIVRTQNDEGGWRYLPQKTPDADISVTIGMIMALRAARDAGIHVPKSCADRCTRYVRKCQNDDGGFKYQHSFRMNSGYARTAAGVVALYHAGVYEGKDVERGVKYLEDKRLGDDGWGGGGRGRSETHYYYGAYYAAQAMFVAGDQHWIPWYRATAKDILAKQSKAGSWFDQISSEYGTAMALIVLHMPLGFLPIFQR